MPAIGQALDVAVHHHQAGRFRQAEEVYEEILRVNPKHPDALHLVGLIAHQRDQHDSAIDRISQAIKLNPRSAVYHNNLASAYLSVNRADEAMASCRSALKIKPDYAAAHGNLGRALASRGEFDEAAVCLRRALAADPRYAELHYHLGKVLVKLGRLEEAAETFKQALEIKPDYPDACSGLGGVLSDLKKPEEAADCFRRTIELNPNSATAHINLGKCLADLEKIEEAVASYRRALELDPDHYSAYVNLSSALKEQEKFEESVECCRRALVLKPDSFEAYVNMGCALKDSGRLSEAEDCCRKALELRPDSYQAHHNMGMIYTIQGKHEQAMEKLQEVLSLKPDHSDSRVALASLKTHSSDDWSEIQRTEELLAQDDLPQRTRSQLHFSLGKSYDDCGQWDRAFDHFREGNRLAGVTFDHEDFLAGVVALEATFSAEFLANPPARGRHSDLPVYIVGMPRSGTTLVEQILSSHPDMAGGGEIGVMGIIRKVKPSFLETIAAYPRGAMNIDRETTLMLADACLDRLGQVDGQARRVSDKMPGNFLHLGLITLLLPRARVIHCRRNPLDTCLSCYFQSFAKRLGYAYDLGMLGFYYRQYERIMAHWRRVLRLPMFEVDYENLVQHQEPVSRALIEFCGLPWDPACLEFQDNQRPVWTASNWQVRQPIYSRSVNRWKHYQRHLGPLIEALGRSQ